MYGNIMITIDLSEPASYRKAFPTAVALCRQFGAGLHILSVLPDLGYGVVQNYFPDDFHDKAGPTPPRRSRRLPARTFRKTLPRNSTWQAAPSTREIIEAAERLGIDLIVMASHRPTSATICWVPMRRGSSATPTAR